MRIWFMHIFVRPKNTGKPRTGCKQLNLLTSSSLILTCIRFIGRRYPFKQSAHLKKDNHLTYLTYQNLALFIGNEYSMGGEITVAESICTQYSNLSGRPDIFLGSETFKKLGTLLFSNTRVKKNQGHCYSKREEAAWSLLFLNKE